MSELMSVSLLFYSIKRNDWICLFARLMQFSLVILFKFEK